MKCVVDRSVVCRIRMKKLYFNVLDFLSKCSTGNSWANARQEAVLTTLKHFVRQISLFDEISVSGSYSHDHRQLIIS